MFHLTHLNANRHPIGLSLDGKKVHLNSQESLTTAHHSTPVSNASVEMPGTGRLNLSREGEHVCLSWDKPGVQSQLLKVADNGTVDLHLDQRGNGVALSDGDSVTTGVSVSESCAATKDSAVVLSYYDADGGKSECQGYSDIADAIDFINKSELNTLGWAIVLKAGTYTGSYVLPDHVSIIGEGVKPWDVVIQSDTFPVFTTALNTVFINVTVSGLLPSGYVSDQSAAIGIGNAASPLGFTGLASQFLCEFKEKMPVAPPSMGAVEVWGSAAKPCIFHACKISTSIQDSIFFTCAIRGYGNINFTGNPPNLPGVGKIGQDEHGIIVGGVKGINPNVALQGLGDNEITASHINITSSTEDGVAMALSHPSTDTIVCHACTITGMYDPQGITIIK